MTNYSLNHRMLSILLTLALVQMSGCATMQAYEGEELPPETVASIRPAFGSLFHTPYIVAVDGEHLSMVDSKCSVIPGPHTVRVGVQSGYGHYTILTTGELDLEAEAGHTYVVCGKIVRGEGVFWIIDDNTGRLVAGNMP